MQLRGGDSQSKGYVFDPLPLSESP